MTNILVVVAAFQPTIFYWLIQILINKSKELQFTNYVAISF